MMFSCDSVVNSFSGKNYKILAQFYFFDYYMYSIYTFKNDIN